MNNLEGNYGAYNMYEQQKACSEHVYQEELDESIAGELLNDQDDNYAALDDNLFLDEDEMMRRALEESRQESICQEVTEEIQQFSRQLIKSFDKGLYFSSLLQEAKRDKMHNALMETIPQEILIKIANVLYNKPAGILALMLVSKRFFSVINENLDSLLDKKFVVLDERKCKKIKKSTVLFNVFIYDMYTKDALKSVMEHFNTQKLKNITIKLEIEPAHMHASARDVEKVIRDLISNLMLCNFSDIANIAIETRNLEIKALMYEQVRAHLLAIDNDWRKLLDKLHFVIKKD